MQVKIQRRYQYRKREGIIWTDWFDYATCEENEANDKLKTLSKRKEPIKNLKGEYRIKQIENNDA